MATKKKATKKKATKAAKANSRVILLDGVQVHWHNQTKNFWRVRQPVEGIEAVLISKSVPKKKRIALSSLEKGHFEMSLVFVPEGAS